VISIPGSYVGNTGIPLMDTVIRTENYEVPPSYEAAISVASSSSALWWSSEEEDGSSPLSTLSLSLAFTESYSSSDPPIGVFTVEYDLSPSLDIFLSQTTGGGFIFDEDTQYLVASTFDNPSSGNRLVRTSESTVPLIVDTSKWLEERGIVCAYGDDECEKPEVVDRIVYNHDSQFDVTVFRWQMPEGHNAPTWIVVTFTPTAYSPTWVTFESSDYWFILLSSVVAFIVCAAAFAFVSLKRGTNIIKLSQPTFLLALTIGGMGMSTSPLFFIGEPNPTNCLFQFFVLHVAFTFTFSALLWKNMRAWKVARANSKLERAMITSRDGYNIIGVLTGIELVLQVGTMLFEPTLPGVEYNELTNSNEDQTGMEEETELSICLMHWQDIRNTTTLNVYGGYFLLASVMLKVGLIGFACFLVFKTKNYSQRYAESQALGFCLYTLTLTTIALSFSTKVADTVQQLKLWTAGITFNVLFAVIGIYGPRLYQLLRHGDYTDAELRDRTKKMGFGTPRPSVTVTPKSMTPSPGSHVASKTIATAKDAGFFRSVHIVRQEPSRLLTARLGASHLSVKTGGEDTTFLAMPPPPPTPKRSLP
jgi:hypothetical protein